METSRRAFLKTSGVGAAAWSLSAGTPSAADRKRIVVGVIGTGGMGANHVRELAAPKDAAVAYVCDVDESRLAAAVKCVEGRSDRAPKAVKDLRHVLDDRAVDAVFIATPDHWHAPASILALDAGKHVYVEKPCCHNVREGRLMVEADRRPGKLL
jgi:predicted dehydrogenase